jgi:hypothetical protein
MPMRCCFSARFMVAERKRLIAEADSAHQVAAQETLSFVRPRRWAFGEHQAAPADRDFLLNLLDEKLSAMCQASRARMVEALGLLGPDDGVICCDCSMSRSMVATWRFPAATCAAARSKTSSCACYPSST